LSSLAAAVIADGANPLHVSVISLTETHRLLRRGKIALQSGLSLDVWFQAEALQHQVQCEPITLEIAHVAEMLPPVHNDPADRFILATARVLGAAVLSPDTVMPQYPGIHVEW